ncbi:uncharacterized protein KY384_006157 [Bacidia gigantensis]|uniref:uncharacterized protein n=1 Tax=Bacidia gigantensis TaxID=2732470 RepID=UPI001D04A225|nr:uncharacterized protein KY384_006157 [Bacidia gigantensis]KAG8529520.1 hypothetical protein KY384_006157 [Bacidia gigantensis]
MPGIGMAGVHSDWDAYLNHSRAWPGASQVKKTKTFPQIDATKATEEMQGLNKAQSTHRGTIQGLKTPKL